MQNDLAYHSDKVMRVYILIPGKALSPHAETGGVNLQFSLRLVLYKHTVMVFHLKA